MPQGIDPIKYEIFRHRLHSILEEGRIAMRMVSGSAVAVEGGETCTGFFTPEGETLCVATGVLPHAAGGKGAVIAAAAEFGEDPGFEDGDQMFMNDPYIVGLHSADQFVIKPIFCQGRLIAWVSSAMHTSETGAIEPGGMSTIATEIYHEGIRIAGLKIVERGKFRKDVFKTLTGQVRDPDLVGLDMKARIASNNVCTSRLLEAVDTFGIDFYERASKKMIEDTEKQARAKLRELPDGTWRARIYGDSTGVEEKPVKIMCSMTKSGDRLTFDYTGTSPQVKGSYNSTPQSTRAYLFAPLAGGVFWDLPWNDGIMAPVEVILPEASAVSCKPPAAVGNSPTTYSTAAVAVAYACVTRMLYAGGRADDITAGWRGFAGGLLYFDGTNQYGAHCTGNILDSFAAGIGGTPSRRGVDTGGHLIAPTASIPDVEAIESRLPFMYLARYSVVDSGGYGKFRGGVASAMIYKVHGTNDFQVGRRGCGKRVTCSLGMFGGYPGAPQPGRVVFDSDVREWFKRSRYPVTFEDVGKLTGNKLDAPPASLPTRPVDEGTIVVNTVCAGGGYGDPLDADPRLVEEDVRKSLISPKRAEEIYGVVLDSNALRLDWKQTEVRRQSIREQRIREGKKVS
ncbi:MAG: hydantoinase B/oxoprolinase family protein [Chloroflexi bacterium]|nr:hydantoinase B/oxoprolinase family protein [Chloroflexota bacterium]